MITNSGNAASPPKKILVVDDNDVIVKTISLKLKTAGFEVLTALDGTDGVAAVRKHKPDLIVLDISFPPDIGGVPWDGFRIIEWLRRVDDSTKIPIIVITGGAGDKDKERAMAMGAIGFLQKPLDHDELLKLVRATLGAPVNAGAR
ncbi:MAG TPA: response regulator [Candidatus Sulfotelmatobacter sp.]|nr:response regulator [Candidatus Sulfotelmatobacter sp.]